MRRRGGYAIGYRVVQESAGWDVAVKTALSRTSAGYVTARFRIFNDGTGPMNLWGSLEVAL